MQMLMRMATVCLVALAGATHVILPSGDAMAAAVRAMRLVGHHGGAAATAAVANATVRLSAGPFELGGLGVRDFALRSDVGGRVREAAQAQAVGAAQRDGSATAQADDHAAARTSATGSHSTPPPQDQRAARVAQQLQVVVGYPAFVDNAVHMAWAPAASHGVRDDSDASR